MKGFFISYALPLALEVLPFWWASPRRLSERLQQQRLHLNYTLTTGGRLSPAAMMQLLVLALVHSVLEAVIVHWRNRVVMENRLVVRRLVMERLLYSEITAYEKLRTLDIEYRVSADIASTLNFFSLTLPQILETIYAVIREGYGLWIRRRDVDSLAVLHPLVMLVLRKTLYYAKYYLMERRQKNALMRTRAQLSRLSSSIMDGLVDIQVNNLQPKQLELLDKIIDVELQSSHSYAALFTKMWNSFGSASVPEFVVELMVAQIVMKRKRLTNVQYNQTQLHVDNLVDYVRKLWGLFQITSNLVAFQHEVKEFMDIPSFLEERSASSGRWLSPTRFERLIVRNVVFSYASEKTPALNLQGEVVFERGKVYAVVGRNRAGKSTLCRLLCKLDRPQAGSIELNGVDYSRVSRIALRERIAYVSQKPYLFPGTVRENILVGNPLASEREVFEAAAAAGLFSAVVEPKEPSLPSLPGALSSRTLRLHAPSATGTPNPLVSGSSHGLTSVSASVATRSALSAADSAEDEREEAASALPQADRSPMGLRRSFSVDSFRAEAKAGNSAAQLLAAGMAAVAEVVTQVTTSPTPRTAASARNSDPDIQPSASGASMGGSTGAAPSLKAASVLETRIEAHGSNLSGGFAQSVALARAFVKCSADLIVLDESMAMMDPFKRRELIYPRLLEFARNCKKTLILITHDPLTAMRADEVVVLDAGRLVSQGVPSEILPTYLPKPSLSHSADFVP